MTLSNDRAAAEDAVHDAFVSFVRFTPRLWLRTSLRSYLLSAVANRVRSPNQVSARRAAPQDATDDAAESPAPDYAALRRERTMLIEQAMARLPYDQREAIILHLQSKLPFREIAEFKEMSINTVLSRYRYGLEKIRSALDGELEP